MRAPSKASLRNERIKENLRSVTALFRQIADLANFGLRHRKSFAYCDSLLIHVL